MSNEERKTTVPNSIGRLFIPISFLSFSSFLTLSLFYLFFVLPLSLSFQSLFLFSPFFLHRFFPHSFSFFLLRLSHVLFTVLDEVMYHYMKIEKEKKLEGHNKVNENVVRFEYSNELLFCYLK